MSEMHFDRMAAEYAEARPPYPAALYDVLESSGVIGGGLRILEVGAGAGLATAELIRRGSEVVAVEPGPRLSAVLSTAVPGVEMIVERLEDAELTARSFDSVVAATSMHWVDLSVGLPRIHRALRAHGWLAVWRNIFGDEGFETAFRHRVNRIVAERSQHDEPAGREQRPTMTELAAGGWFEPVRTERWQWSVDLSSDQVGRLFSTFSNWTEAEVRAAVRAADDLGGTVTEHYRSVLHLLRATPLAAGEKPTGLTA